jgi:hypothetical protein
LERIKQPANLYLLSITLLGIIGFVLLSPFSSLNSADWVITLTLVGVILLLNHYTIPIPPDGNSISMDSAIYLASLFLYGLNLTLEVLLINSIIYAIFKWKIVWWKHLFNFSIYCIMTMFAYFLFIFCDGTVGNINTRNLLPYVISTAAIRKLNQIIERNC